MCTCVCAFVWSATVWCVDFVPVHMWRVYATDFLEVVRLRVHQRTASGVAPRDATERVSYTVNLCQIHTPKTSHVVESRQDATHTRQSASKIRLEMGVEKERTPDLLLSTQQT